MSFCSLSLAMLRIKWASPGSPIAVFKERKDKNGVPCVRVVFAATVRSQQEIKTNDDLVGVFDGTDSMGVVRERLRQVLSEG